MNIVITIAAIGLSLVWKGIVNRVAYVFSRGWNLRVNKTIMVGTSRRIFAVFATYMDFRFTGDMNSLETLPGQYVAISNHQSLFDIPLFNRYIPNGRLRFVAKAELGRHIPIVSLMLRSGGHCLVPRTGGGALAMREMDRFAERVSQNGWIPVIFPEGTRSADGNVGKFHAAGFRRFTERCPLPVAVFAIDGGWKISKLSDMAKTMRGGRYRIKLLKVYDAPRNKAEQVRILEEGRALIEAQLDEWRA